MSEKSDVLNADEGYETFIERATRELEKELASRIKTAKFHEKVKTSLEISERLLENGKLSPEKIADVTMMPIRFVNKIAEELKT